MVKSNNLDDLFNRRIPEIDTLNMWEEHKSDIATKLEAYSWGYSDDFER